MLTINYNKLPITLHFFSSYSAFLIFITYSLRIFFNTNILKEFSTYLYGLAWGVGICGLLIDMVYSKKIIAKYGLTHIDLVLTELLVHIIPLIIVQMYSPHKRKTPIWILCVFPLILGGLYLLLFDFTKIYPGVPLWIFIILYPCIVIGSVLLKYL